MRKAGVLMPVSALPSRIGAGELGESAFHFIELLKENHVKIWQILPLNPVGYGNSPYQPYSSCAGDELYISLDALADEGLLKEHPKEFQERATRVDYEAVRQNRQKLPAEVETEAQYQMFLQYIFYTQWMKVKKAANDAGIQIMGDVPFYVGQDSVDVWGGKDNFLLDTDGRPIFIAGVPPDYFSATGQRWGNPIYDWEHMKEQDYRFWVDRIGYSNKLFDIIRIDHFRAFDTYWKIPADCPTAIDGEWIEAPGYEVIDTLQKEIPGLDLVAEDLGLLRPEVLMLKDHYHLKGMKILIFSIETGGKYARDTFHDVENMIFYTGTHDNDTIMQWYGNMSAAARRKIRRMLKKAGASQGSVKDRFLQYTMQNQAEYAIIPLADILGLGKEGHINTPGTIGSPNWEWHLPDFIQAKKELQKFGRLIVDTKR